LGGVLATFPSRELRVQLQQFLGNVVLPSQIQQWRPDVAKRLETPMTLKKTLQQREKELQSLLAVPASREELQELAFRYSEESGRLRPMKTSIITYILVHEREHGLIIG
jgi:hypothetical protein